MSTELKRWRDGLTNYHYVVLAVACFGWLFDTMDQWLFVFAKKPAMTALMPGATAEVVDFHVMIVTAFLMIGWATGGIFFGLIGDRLGRTRTMIVTILIYALFTGLSGLARNWWEFGLLRFLVGFGVGGEFAAGAALVAETFPAHARATALGIVQATSALGNIMAGVIYLVITRYFAMEDAWRWVFAVGILPAMLVVVIFFYVREPDSWLAAREKARHSKGLGLGSFASLFGERELRKNTLIGVGIAAVGVIGFWGISVFGVDLLRTVLKPRNLEPKMIELYVSFAGMVQNAGGIAGALLFPYVTARLGRRMTFGISFVLSFVACFCAFQFTTSFVTALIFFAFMGFALLMNISGFTVYFPELFPTRVRATGTGFCYNVARYITAVGLFGIGMLTTAVEMKNAALLTSLIFVLGLFILPFAPETKGKPLPE